VRVARVHLGWPLLSDIMPTADLCWPSACQTQVAVATRVIRELCCVLCVCVCVCVWLNVIKEGTQSCLSFIFILRL
jgi:hypothetical protein